jgi:hypothetical protein
MERAKYSTDVTDKQWEIIASLLKQHSSSKAGRPLELDCQCHSLPYPYRMSVEGTPT